MRWASLPGLLILGAATLAHAGQDAGDTPAPPSNAAPDPWAADARRAADAENAKRATIEQQARQQCVAQIYAADYDTRSYPNSQAAISAREAADDCLARARAFFRKRADEQEQMNAFYEQARQKAQLAEEQRRIRKQQEQEAQAAAAREQAEQDAAEQHEEEARAKDPAFGRARLSALLCYVASSRKLAKQKLDEQRQGARAGLGIIDKEVVYEWQGELLTMSKLEAMVRGETHKRKVSALSCKPDEVKAFDECIHEARQATLMLGPGDDEYVEDAKRIVEAGANCTPWKRLTPPAAAAGQVPAAPAAADGR